MSTLDALKQGGSIETFQSCLSQVCLQEPSATLSLDDSKLRSEMSVHDVLGLRAFLGMIRRKQRIMLVDDNDSSNKP